MATNTIGVPAHIKGYPYLREAIIIAVNDMDVINAITKVLYPQVAKTFQSGAGHPPRHRSGLGSWRSGHPAKIFWLHSQQYQGKTDQF